MKYHEYKPEEQLSDFIRCYWTLESEDEQPEKERIFPDGCMELIFHYGDQFRKYPKAGPPELQPRFFLHGQLRRYMELEPTGRIGIFSVRFEPSGLSAFTGKDLSSVTDKTIGISELWPGSGVDLEKQMISCASTEERIRLIETFLKTVIVKKERTGMVHAAVRRIIDSDGTVSVEDLALNLNTNKRTLERNFSVEVGLSPKHFARVIRFNKALQLIEKKDFSSFTSVAHEGGFYDQAHFIRDFRQITGLNPKKYFSENLEMVRFFNL